MAAILRTGKRYQYCEKTHHDVGWRKTTAIQLLVNLGWYRSEARSAHAYPSALTSSRYRLHYLISTCPGYLTSVAFVFLRVRFDHQVSVAQCDVSICCFCTKWVVELRLLADVFAILPLPHLGLPVRRGFQRQSATCTW